jgi:hypothetical protein
MQLFRTVPTLKPWPSFYTYHVSKTPPLATPNLMFLCISPWLIQSITSFPYPSLLHQTHRYIVLPFCWQPKLFILRSCQNMKWTSPLCFSRRDGQNIYGTFRTWMELHPWEDAPASEFWRTSKLPRNLKNPAWVPGVIPMPEVLTDIRTSDRRWNFWQT